MTGRSHRGGACRCSAGSRVGLVRVASLLAGAVMAASCGVFQQDGNFGWIGASDRPSGGFGPLRVQWIRELADGRQGPYLPLETAGPAVDARTGRVYVGLTTGEVWALNRNGRRVFKYRTESSVEAQIAVDAERGELFIATENGIVHALDADSQQRKWRADLHEPIRKRPLLLEDALYVAAGGDAVAALSRISGETLWAYRRERPDGFAVSGYAALTLANKRLITGFTDGVVVALDVGDGRVLWQIDTSIHVEPGAKGMPAFSDVDTTPAVLGQQVFVASYAAGLYALNVRTGGIDWREPELTGITALAARPGRLVIASADRGLVCMDPASRRTLWRRPAHRGPPTSPVIHRQYLIAGESRGALRLLALDDGRELARVESGTGFSARAAVLGGMAFAVSNGGTVYAFRMN